MEFSYWINLIKISLIAFFGWLGLQIDIVPLVLYSILWFIENVTYLFKVGFLYRKVNFTDWVFRAIKNMSVLIIPLIIVVLVKVLDQDSDSLYRSSVFMITFYISLTSIGNVISLFSGREYNFDEILVKWFEDKFKKK